MNLVAEAISQGGAEEEASSELLLTGAGVAWAGGGSEGGRALSAQLNVPVTCTVREILSCRQIC